MDIKRVVCAVFLMLIYLNINSCINHSEPEVLKDVEPDLIIVGLKGNTKQLEKGTHQFSEISDEALKCFQGIYVPAETILSFHEIDTLKTTNKYVEIVFSDSINITISRLAGEKKNSNRQEYEIVELSSALFLLDEDSADHVIWLCPDFSFWNVWASKRSFNNLEEMSDLLLDELTPIQ
jgi:hypothetical protein